jgi:ankyrin repeat protein
VTSQIDVAIANKQRDVAVQQDIMLAEVVEIKASVTRLEHAQQAGQVPEAQEPTPTASPSRSGSLPSTSTARSSSSWGSWLWFRGIKWGIISAAGANQKTYEVWARFVLPTSGSDASQALIAALVLRVRSPLNFNFGPRTGISVSNLVPEDAAIMLACKNGDLRQVRILLDTGQADAADITMNNRTPLDYAIESGNIDLVECLIRWKRSLVNQPFGTRSTSPLQSAVYERNIEMARLLLHYRADGDHLSAFGWNALFYLWVEEDHASHDGTPKSTIEFLRMFNASNISFDLTIRDSWGWTAVQRAAAEGKAEEVSAILALSEAPMTTARGLGPAVTEAIKTAVDSGDNEIFTALLPAYGDIDRPLDNEWTLLETAAYHGHEQIMLKLLRAGAEEFALDGPCFPDLITEIPAPDDLDDAAWDTERCKLYMKVLVEAGKVIKCVESNEDGVDEELYFWDSSEEPLVES